MLYRNIMCRIINPNYNRKNIFKILGKDATDKYKSMYVYIKAIFDIYEHKNFYT